MGRVRRPSHLIPPSTRSLRPADNRVIFASELTGYREMGNRLSATSMSIRARGRLLIAALSGLLLPAAYAYAVTIDIAEVRDEMAFVKGSDAGRKQQILWEGAPATTANGKGNFSF